VAWLYLGLAVLGALLCLNAYVPVRRDPLSTASFFAGWLTGELAVQSLLVEIMISLLLVSLGALSSWVGWLALGLSLGEFGALLGLAVVAARAAEVVSAALAGATGPRLAVGPPPQPVWARWWRLTRAVPLRSRRVAVTANVDYWGDGSPKHRLDVIVPRDQDRTRPAPVMVYVHGGAWMAGDKREQGKPMLYELALAGWVCVTVNYRLSPKATWPDHVVDVKRALAWVHQHIAEFGGDPSFVAVSGGSAGGHLAALVALTAGDPAFQPGFEAADTSVAAAVPFYGVYDMTADPESTGRYGRGLQMIVEREVMKTDIAGHRELFEAASPTYRVRGDAPPFFVLHGSNDTLVPVESARQFVTELRATSEAPVAYAELPLAQHAFDILASPRCRATPGGVLAFLTAVRAARPGDPGAPADGAPAVPAEAGAERPDDAGSVRG
jgi:acetyl esterase/lipase